jgi:fatty-acyl-CoA synthase
MEEQAFIKAGYDYQLTLNHLLEHAAKLHPRGEIVYRDIYRGNYKELYERCQRLSNALEGLGVKQGSKVITFDWNTHRFLEIYFAVPCMGAIMHMGNPALTPAQTAYIINHAEDEIVIFNKDFLPLIEGISDELKTVKHYVVLTDDGKLPETKLKPISEYENLLSVALPKYEYPELNENTAASLGYTTGTTGNPKGCWFTHRQISIHAMVWGSYLFGHDIIQAPYGTILILVPMFHVHQWGLPYMATYFGIKQMMTGRIEPPIILEMIKREREKVPDQHISIFGVASVLRMLVYHPKIEEYKKYLSNVTYIGGGASFPRGLAERCIELGINPGVAWGMTECCPIMGASLPKSHMKDWTEDKKLDFFLRTGWAAPFSEQRVVDEKGNDVPKDGRSFGEIIYRAPWATLGYYKEPEKSEELWRGGWLHTGDIATIDEEENILIVDRAKDVIKSGGEWISTLTLEDLLSRQPKVKEVAVIGAAHEKYDERAIALVVPKEEHKGEISEEELREHLTKYAEAGRIVKWWIPEKFIFVDEIPKTSVGKYDKKVLRTKYNDVLKEG